MYFLLTEFHGEFSKVSHSFVFKGVHSPQSFFLKMEPEAMMDFPNIGGEHLRISK